MHSVSEILVRGNIEPSKHDCSVWVQEQRGLSVPMPDLKCALGGRFVFYDL